MTTLGFNFPEKTIEDMIEFCECFEQIEDDVIPKKKKSSRQESSSSSSKKTTRKRITVSLSSSSSSSDDSSEDERFKWCKYHGKCAHTTDECEDIERMCKEDKKRKRRTRFNDRKRDVKRRTKYVKKSEVNALAVKKKLKGTSSKKESKKDHRWAT